MKPRKLLILLCLVFMISCMACGKGAESGQDEPEITAQEEPEVTAPEQEPAETVSWPLTLTDQAGREVVLEKPAERIVSCYYISTYACIALDVEERLVGIENKANTRPIYAMAAPELLELPGVGTMKELNLETIAAQEPELVIMPKKLLESAESLTELGIPVLVVYPETQELLEEMLVLIAEACGVKDAAEELLVYYDETLTELQGFAGSTDTSIYMASNSSYLSTAPDGMYQADIIAKAGGVNAAGALEGDYWTEVSYEDLLTMNPDCIILPANAEYQPEDIQNDAALAEVTAVKNGAIYRMPDGFEEWDSPVPSGILGIRWLCSVLHEETYGFEEMQEDVAEFYKKFYGCEIDKTLITK